MSNVGKETPIEIGKKLGFGGGSASQIDGKGYGLSNIVAGAKDVLEKYSHRVSEYLIIDYMVDEETGRMQFHIFPRVPDHNKFYPDYQKFAKAIEESVIKIIGKGARIEAEFHEEDGIGPDGRKSDTRVTAYPRNKEGEFSSIKYPYPVPMVWFCIHELYGTMMPRKQLIEVLVNNVVDGTEQAIRA